MTTIRNLHVLKIICTSASLALACSSAHASELTLSDLKKTVVATHASWQPIAAEQPAADVGDIFVGGLIEEDREVALPSHPFQPSIEVPRLGRTNQTFSSPIRQSVADASVIDPTPLPTIFDWRDHNGQSYMSPIVAKQGACGSCASFATIAALEAQLNIACGAPQRSFDLSRQYFFSCGGGTCRTGWKLSSAMAFLGTAGVTDGACMPYLSENGEDVACNAACSDAGRRLLTGIKASQPTVGFIDVNAIKRGIMRGPLVANMILFEDLKFYDQGIYRHIQGDQLGTHAIVLVGWNDEQKSWYARNSWGESWGDHGYFAIAWDDVSLPGRYTWALDATNAVQAGICTAFPR